MRVLGAGRQRDPVPRPHRDARIADPTNPIGFRRIGMFRAGSGTLDYWESEPEAGLSLVRPGHSPGGEAYTTWRGKRNRQERLEASTPVAP